MELKKRIGFCYDNFKHHSLAHLCSINLFFTQMTAERTDLRVLTDTTWLRLKWFQSWGGIFFSFHRASFIKINRKMLIWYETNKKTDQMSFNGMNGCKKLFINNRSSKYLWTVSHHLWENLPSPKTNIWHSPTLFYPPFTPLSQYFPASPSLKSIIYN